MCGLAGYINLSKKPVKRGDLESMIRVARHRGPDDEGYYIYNNIGLGHCRLSIIDLSKAGHQPMFDRDKKICVVHNGEVYNFIELRRELESKGYHFTSNTDTEVLIHGYAEWGKGLLDKINGMFAFAILDLRDNTLFCTRDRLGIKPFYYYYDRERFLFASEIKQIVNVNDIPRVANLGAISDYLSFQYALSDETFFSGIKRRLPGHTITLDLKSGALDDKTYWDLGFNAEEGYPEDDLSGSLKGLLEDSVRLRLRSDVPLACSLSGGVDSSSVTCMASRLSSDRLKAFTANFADGEYYDESRWARVVASHAGVDYREILVNSQQFEELLEKVIWHLDEPVAGPSIMPQYLVSKAASRETKVILGGLGGDELFGGYRWYSQFLFQNIIDRLGFAPNALPDRSNLTLFKDFIAKYGARSFLSSVRRFSFAEDPGRTYARILSIFTEREHHKLTNGMDYNPIKSFQDRFNSMNGESPIATLFKFDLKYYLPALLHLEDRASMAVSLESRVPILDHRIADLASRIPVELKLKRGLSKSILRESMIGLVPDEILKRQDKKGFPTPFGIWYSRNEDSPLVKRFLDTECSFLNREYIKSIHREHNRGLRNHSTRLWRLMCVSLWKDIFNVNG